MKSRIFAVTLVAVGLLVPAAATVFAPSARAQSSCDLGFALTYGGVPPADLNSNGLTCELNMIDSVTGVWATLAVDDEAAPLAEPRNRFCPDDFVPNFVPPGFPPDRNEDGCVCVREDLRLSADLLKRKKFQAVDNNAAKGNECILER